MKKFISLLLASAMVLVMGVSAYAVEGPFFTEKEAIKYGVHIDAYNLKVKGSDFIPGTYKVVPVKNPYVGGASVMTYDEDGRLITLTSDFSEGMIYIDDSAAEVVLSNCTVDYVSAENVVPSPFQYIDYDIISEHEFD